MDHPFPAVAPKPRYTNEELEFFLQVEAHWRARDLPAPNWSFSLQFFQLLKELGYRKEPIP